MQSILCVVVTVADSWHINGGTGPYTIEMRFLPAAFNNHTAIFECKGPLFSSPDAAPAGQYTIVVTDANGCTSSATLDLVDPPCLELHVSFTPPSVDQCDGTITAYGFRRNTVQFYFILPHMYRIIFWSVKSVEYFNCCLALRANVTDVPFYNYGNQLCPEFYVVTIADSQWMYTEQIQLI